MNSYRDRSNIFWKLNHWSAQTSPRTRRLTSIGRFTAYWKGNYLVWNYIRFLFNQSREIIVVWFQPFKYNWKGIICYFCTECTNDFTANVYNSKFLTRCLRIYWFFPNWYFTSVTGWERKVHVTHSVDLYSGQILVWSMSGKFQSVYFCDFILFTLNISASYQ